NVHITNMGPTGVRLARKLKPDIVIVDLLMPDMDGWQVCREIRKFSQVPIIILSVLNKPEMVAKALDLGADDYLIKPVGAKLLEARINTLTRRAEAEKSAFPASH
ncbi:MAG: response regulator, partial [candidate division Zixibacteria bacterium]|nr:response regulator [candidate division Zixibacteria bacterium]NIS46770.1 response regulator [candidate division Zixibacteria bacterium]NIU14899.1 response regulator [candidate division Zixibacteria bacterium]NIV06896.1 response regulator [candidate division Zixibacteria bacterium]NIW42677.1 response regulator [candidate division Zixibacteria bacterium]